MGSQSTAALVCLRTVSTHRPVHSDELALAALDDLAGRTLVLDVDLHGNRLRGNSCRSLKSLHCICRMPQLCACVHAHAAGYAQAWARTCSAPATGTARTCCVLNETIRYGSPSISLPARVAVVGSLAPEQADGAGRRRGPTARAAGAGRWAGLSGSPPVVRSHCVRRGVR